MESIELGLITPSPTNPRKRFDARELDELAASIRQHDVMQPILVRPIDHSMEFKYEIVAGERRYRASKLADKQTIPAIVRELDDVTALQLQILENLQRSDLHPLEEANGFKALLANKSANSWTADQLAEKVGKSRSYIYASLKLCDLCTYSQDKFLDGKFGREIALLIARIQGEVLQIQATKEICEAWQGVMSYRDARNHVHHRYTLQLNKAVFDRHSTSLVPAAGSCLSCPKRSGNVPEIHPDIESPDVCTDPDCFEIKRTAHIELLKVDGRTVLEGDAAKKIAPNSWTIKGGYVDVTSNAPGKAESFVDLLGDDMPSSITVVRPDDKKIMTLITKEDAVAALAGKGIKVGFAQEQSQRERDLEQERLAKVETAYRLAVLTTSRLSILDQLTNADPGHPMLEDYELIIVCEAMLDGLDHETTKRLLKIYRPDYDKADPYGATRLLKQSITDMTNRDRLLMLVDMALIGRCYANQYNMQPHAALETIAFHNGVNTGVIRDEVEQQLAPKPKGKKSEKIKTPSTPPSAAPAEENDAPEKLEETTEPAAQAEKPLPAKLQAIKDAELAKRARRDQRQKQKESAGADVQTGAAEATQTSEVPNV